MNFIRLLPVSIASILMAAHFARADALGAAFAALALPFLLLARGRWAVHAVRVFLAGGSLLWLSTMFLLVDDRQRLGEPWIRTALILGGAALFTAVSGLVFRGRALRNRYPKTAADGPKTAAFFLTFALLSMVQWKAPLRMLLIDRILPDFGWLEILFLSAYAAWMAGNLLDRGSTGRWRFRLWTLFSAVFFGQLLLGLAGLDEMLMTGTLHLPIPAMIVAGPLFRAGRFFMPILFLAAVAVVGPAWCSHLCYVGAWDAAAARLLKRPLPLPSWVRFSRPASLVMVAAAALLLRAAGASMGLAIGLGLAFGVAGILIMFLVSSKRGAMTHCIAYCPIGFLSTALGRISPFRLRINSGCTDCQACRTVCRYDALRPEDIKRRRPALTCTLCGDCLAACHGRFIEYKFLGLSPDAARALFIVLVVSLHALFLGVARI